MSVENNVKLDAAVAPAIASTPAVELIYVGFWRRLAAYGIDFAILLPYALLARQLIYTSRSAYLANLIVPSSDARQTLVVAVDDAHIGQTGHELKRTLADLAALLDAVDKESAVRQGR
jgi:hypothetical protein